MVRVDVRRGHGATPDGGDNQVRPATYSDNYVTLWPGQSQTIEETYDASLLAGADPVVSVGGYNVAASAVSDRGGCGPTGPGIESFGLADGEAPSGNPTPGQENTPAAMAALRSQVQTGRWVDSSAGGSVPATLALGLGAPVSFGAFQPGSGHVYDAGTTADVVSTAGDATLSVADPNPATNGHLVNGTRALPQPLQVQGSDGTFSPVSAAPAAVHHYDGPVSHDVQPVGFKQPIGSGDALRTGAYSTTLTFTLSTTQP
jgi:hypothetical protein